MFWLLNNYNIRGLDGLSIEPRAGAPTQSLGYGASPFGLPASFPSGPALPGTSGMAASPFDTPSPFNQANNQAAPFGAPGFTQGYSAGYSSTVGANNPLLGALPGALPGTSPGALPSTSANSLPSTSSGIVPIGGQAAAQVGGGMISPPPGAAAQWDQLLTVGEKLGMLERTRQAVPSAAPVYQTQSSHVLAGVQQPAVAMQPRDTIRIASFNLSGWGDASRDRPAVTEMLVRLIGQFDIVALQDIRSKRDDLLPNLMIELNRGGRAFDFMIGPRVGRGDTREQLAFVFDTDRIETDRFQLYTVADPEDIMTREPLVGWFRTRQVSEREAFTFSLVNMHIDSNLAAAELAALPNLVEAIYSDGRGEDDIILAGDFSAAGSQSAFFTSGLFRTAIEGIATNTRGTHLLDNIAIPVMGGTEYMGRAGAIDFLRQYNLGLEQALSVSEHLPIWAEFSIIEGGRPGQVAGNLMPERNFHAGQTN